MLDLAERGCFGLHVPEDLGGLALRPRDLFAVLEQLGAIDIALAALVGIHNGLGLVPILTGGSDALRRELLPRLAGGRGLAAFALTESVAGSNPRALRTTAQKVDGGYRLDGDKMWIGLAPWASVIVVIANAEDASGRPLGTMCCLVRSDNDGLIVGDELLTHGVRAIPQNHVHLRSAFVPDADVLGAPGHGLEVAQAAMQFARLGIAATAIGSQKRCAQLALRYAERRQVQGGLLLQDATARQRLVWMSGAIAAGEDLLAACARRLESGEELPFAMPLVAKALLSEWLGTTADWTMQMLGGRGYAEPNELPQLVRDARVLRIFEGPTETLLAHFGAQVRREPSEAARMLGEGLDGTLAARLHAAIEVGSSDASLGAFAGALLVLAHANSEAAKSFATARAEEAERALSASGDVPACDAVAAAVRARTASIGTIERRAAGEDRQRDALLRVDGTSPSTMAPRTVGPSQPPRAPGAHDDLMVTLRTTACEVLSRSLGRPLTELPEDQPLTAYGLDSLAAAELGLALEEKLGRKLAPDLVHQCGTLRALAAALAPASNGGADKLARYRSSMARMTEMRAKGRYPFYADVSAHEQSYVRSGGRRQLMLAAYDYLGLVRHPKLEAAMVNAVRTFGTGHGGAAILAGKTEVHNTLEERLATFVGAEDALAFQTGYGANHSTVTALVGPGDCVLGDEWNHASLADGCRASGAHFATWPHNDLDTLERLLRENHGKHTLVVVDSVFSMEGDIADVPTIARLCRRHGALLMVDEAHSFGVLGKAGRGVQEHFDLPPDAIDVKMGTLSKALAGIGGFVAGKRELVDYLRHAARGYLFSGALPAANAAASLAALDVVAAEPERVAALQHNAARWKQLLDDAGFDTLQSCTPIVPVHLRDEATTLEYSHHCRERGLFVVPVMYPAVPMDAPRLRTCVSAIHTEAELQFARDVLVEVGRELGVVR